MKNETVKNNLFIIYVNDGVDWNYHSTHPTRENAEDSKQVLENSLDLEFYRFEIVEYIKK